MLNVLINAYAVSPTWGSEPGMGWNWIINIAKYCNVFVITESEWKEDILKAVNRLPQKKNLHFYFNPVSDKVRKMCWNQGDWRFYRYYRKWQQETLTIAQDIIAHNKIDVMHQLNMIGFREPGYLWKIKDIPLVWEPIGGILTIPKAYRNGFSRRDKFMYSVKPIISDLQLKFHPRVKKMIKRAYVIGATKSVNDKIFRFYGKDIPLINETGTNETESSESEKNVKSTFDILWVGRLIPTKRLDIALKAISLTKNPNIRLSVCGAGHLDEVRYYQKMIDDLGIAEKVNWLGKVNHDLISGLMKKSDLFFMTSVADATSTVIVEAISENLPILSFNACGFGSIVNGFAGETIELSTPKQSALDFAEKIDYLTLNPQRLSEIKATQQKNKHILSWDYKGQKMVEIYTSLLK